MLATFRDFLLCVFLAVLCASVAKTFLLLDQASAVLSDLQSVTTTVSAAAREQRSYYKATGKALAITTIRLGRLVENTDARLERLSQSSERTLETARESLATVTTGTEDLLSTANRELAIDGQVTRETLASARANLEEMRPLWPPLTRTAESVAGSTRSVEVALEPLRKPAGRWKRALMLFVGMLKINIL